MQWLITLLPLFVTFVASTSKTPVCTNGFTLINNKCLKLFPNAATHNAAERSCMTMGATLVTSKNANDNQAITNIVGSSASLVWIGLYCFDSDSSKCLWDDASGAADKYDNFASGFPLVDIGKCVYYSAKGALAGQWLNGDCVTDSHAYICELPYTLADNCTNNYNGNCYNLHPTNAAFVQAQTACEQECGNLVSITSELENRYISTLFSGSVMIGGTWTSTGVFGWVDGSRWTYNNLDRVHSSSTGPCVAMTGSYNGYDYQPGSWFGIPCTSAYFFMCKRPAGLKCDGSQPVVTVTPVPSNPSYCNSTLVLAQGTITSPNYPSNYDNNVYCTYQLATIGSYNIGLKFTNFVTESCCDKVFVYDGDSTDSPLVGTYSGNQGGRIVSSSGNTMTLVFKTDSSNVGQGFSARFDSYAYGN